MYRRRNRPSRLSQLGFLYLGNRRALQGGGGKWTPRKLFAAGEQGVWYDPSDWSTLYQDSAGTLPVTAVGQPVGLMLDKSGRGNHLTLTGSVLARDASGQYSLYMAGAGSGVTPTLNLSAYSEATLWIGYDVDTTAAMCIAEFSGAVSANNGAFSLFQGIGKDGLAAPTKTQFTLRSVALVRSDEASIQPGTKLSAVLSVNTSTASAASQLRARLNGSEVAGALAGGPVTVAPLGDYLFYVGARAASNLRLSGHIYSIMMVAGAVSDSVRISGDTYTCNKMNAASRPVAAPNVVDLFVTAGQSNAEGRGVAAESPTVADGTAWMLSGSTFSRLTDPFGGASTGSAWPSFANKWKELTGRSSVWLEQATGGSALIPAAGPTNWSQTGTHYPACVSAANAAVAAINANAAYTLGNVYICWAQGEQEGLNYNGTTITDALYQAAQNELFAALKTNIPTLSKIFVSALGKLTNANKDAEHTLIRNAQAASVAGLPYAHIAFAGATSFVPAKMTDNVHYNQTGYNEMGVGMATAAASVVYP